MAEPHVQQQQQLLPPQLPRPTLQEAVAREHKEVLSAMAAIHSDVEAQRAALRALQRSHTKIKQLELSVESLKGDVESLKQASNNGVSAADAEAAQASIDALRTELTTKVVAERAQGLREQEAFRQELAALRQQLELGANKTLQQLDEHRSSQEVLRSTILSEQSAARSAADDSLKRLQKRLEDVEEKSRSVQRNREDHQQVEARVLRLEERAAAPPPATEANVSARFNTLEELIHKSAASAEYEQATLRQYCNQLQSDMASLSTPATRESSLSKELEEINTWRSVTNGIQKDVDQLRNEFRESQDTFHRTFLQRQEVMCKEISETRAEIKSVQGEVKQKVQALSTKVDAGAVAGAQPTGVTVEEMEKRMAQESVSLRKLVRDEVEGAQVQSAARSVPTSPLPPAPAAPTASKELLAEWSVKAEELVRSKLAESNGKSSELQALMHHEREERMKLGSALAREEADRTMAIHDIRNEVDGAVNEERRARNQLSNSLQKAIDQERSDRLVENIEQRKVIQKAIEAFHLKHVAADKDSDQDEPAAALASDLASPDRASGGSDANWSWLAWRQ